jgi:hypothetical protein
LEVDSLPFKPLQSCDVYDSPPLWLRIVMGLDCLAGGVLMLAFALTQGLGIAAIIISGGLVIALYLLWIVPTGASLALVDAVA